MQLQLGEEFFEVDDNLEFYNKTFKNFSQGAVICAEKLIREYKKCQNFDSGFHTFINIFNDNIEKNIEMACKMLFKLGVYNISATEFAEKYYDKYISVDSIMKELTEKLKEILDFADDLELKQEIKKIGRTQWTGGGFGLRGAISGAITATVLNATYNTAYAIGDTIKKKSNNSKIEKLKNDLYSDPQIIYTLFWAIYNSSIGVFAGLRDELEDFGVLKPINFDPDTAMQISENALKYSDNEKQLKELLVKSVFMNPYDFLLYEPLFLKFEDLNGLQSFAEYFGTYKVYKSYIDIELQQRLEHVSKSPDNNYRQLCFKIDCYIKIYKDYNFDVTERIRLLYNKFLNLCDSIELLDEAINFIKKQFNEDIELCLPLISLLETRRNFLFTEKRKKEKKEKLDVIYGMSENTTSELLEKIIAYYNFSMLYEHPMNSYVKKLTKKIIDRGDLDSESVTDAINRINNYAYENTTNEQKNITLTFVNILSGLALQNEYNNILNLPERTPDEILLKIKKIINYAEKNNTGISDEFEALLIKLASSKLSYQNIQNIFTELKNIASEISPLINSAINAFKVKEKICKFEEEYFFNTLYIFSSDILDIVSKARNGNHICQQWLINLLCNNGLLKLLNSNKKKNLDINNTNTICSNLSIVIMYLFDNPQKYSFDLYMRLRFNSIDLDTYDEYIDTLKIFSNDEYCVVGKYEYGLLTHKYLNHSEGLKIIEETAFLGYRKAVEFMYTYYKNKEHENEFFYKLLLRNISDYQFLYEIDDNATDALCSFSVERIQKIISDDSLIHNIDVEKDFSEFLYNSWESFNRLAKNHSIYDNVAYINGHSENIDAMKIATSFFQTDSNEKTLFSLCSSNDEYIILFTNKGIRYKNRNKIYYESYSANLCQSLDNLFSKGYIEYNLLYQLYIISYYFHKQYNPNLSTIELEKMAYCGNPLAICNLLSNSNYNLSDEKQEFWLELKEKWQSQGKYFAVCPNCHEVRTKEDMFCPECGTKIY